MVHSSTESHEGKQDSVGSWLNDSHWHVRPLYPALLPINGSEPRIVTVQDQTV